MSERGRWAVGIAAAAALLVGNVGVAGAASTASYVAVPGQATVTVPTPAGLEPSVVFAMPDATGLTATYDATTGAFSGTFSSAEYTVTRTVSAGPPELTATQRVQFLAPGGFDGAIDPATGTGTATTSLGITTFIESISSGSTVTAIGAACVIPSFAVTYDVVTSGIATGPSAMPMDLVMTARTFTMPAGTCTIDGAPAPDAITNGLNDALALPNAGATSMLAFVGGPVPTPPPTTTTTIPATTTTTAFVDVDCPDLTHDEAQALLAADASDPHGLDADEDGEACDIEAAAAVRADARFTG